MYIIPNHYFASPEKNMKLFYFFEYKRENAYVFKFLSFIKVCLFSKLFIPYNINELHGVEAHPSF